MSVTVLVGNPKAASRTLGVASAVADALIAGLRIDGPPLVVDLATVASSIFDWDSAEVGALTEAVAGSDLVVVASPTYKATYTGLLKGFLDRYGNDGLVGTVAVPVMTGAASIHALAAEVHLRPLLVELGATVPARGLYVTESQLPRLEAVVEAWSASALPVIRRALG